MAQVTFDKVTKRYDGTLAVDALELSVVDGELLVLLGGVNTPASSGSVIGPNAGVRTDILTAEETMYTTKITPAATLAAAQKAVDATISAYNQRLG